MKNITISLVVAVSLVAFLSLPAHSQESAIAQVTYACGATGTIDATFLQSHELRLTFSDGSILTLRQTRAADGARYPNADESFVFWAKGNGAFIEKSGTTGGPATARYGCIEIARNPGKLSRYFAGPSESFSIRYPADWTVNPSYQYTYLGPGKSIHGVSFTIPPTFTAGTNLASDTSLSVETLPNSSLDNAAPFLQHADLQPSTTCAGRSSSIRRRDSSQSGLCGNPERTKLRSVSVCG
ncbi:MAG TPA: MliC family protein [Spirochaetia bacterium]|nr:MliC family protein [Spirochaetia bacterium]